MVEINELGDALAPAADEYIHVVQNGNSRRATLEDLRNLYQGTAAQTHLRYDQVDSQTDASLNVSSVAEVSTGDFYLNMSTAYGSTGDKSAQATGVDVNAARMHATVDDYAYVTDAVRCHTRRINLSAADADQCGIIVGGDL